MRKFVQREKPDPTENREELIVEENPRKKNLHGDLQHKKIEDNGELASKNLLVENNLEDDICNSLSLCLETN